MNSVDMEKLATMAAKEAVKEDFLMLDFHISSPVVAAKTNSRRS